MIDVYSSKCVEGFPYSPWCKRLEAFLAVSRIPFRSIEETDILKAVYRKLPVIRDNQMQIEDDRLIIDYVQKKRDFDFDGHLDAEQKAVHTAFRSLVTEELYPVILACQWLEPHNLAVIKKQLFFDVPPPFSTLKIRQIQQQVKNLLIVRGYHSGDLKSLYRQGTDTLGLLEDFLGVRQWYGGLYVSLLDLTVVSFLYPLLKESCRGTLADVLKTSPALYPYLERTSQQLFREKGDGDDALMARMSSESVAKDNAV